MSRTRQELQTDIDVIDQAESIVWEIKTGPPTLDSSFPAIPDAVPLDQQGAWQERRRRELLQPRADAMASRVRRLAELRPRLDRLAHRYLSGPKFSARYCRVLGATPVTPPGSAWICRWGCHATNIDYIDGVIVGCCDAVLDELRRMRDGVQRELQSVVVDEGPALVATLPRDRGPMRGLDPFLFTKRGNLRAPVQRILRVLPAKEDAAHPRAWNTIADAANLNRDDARKLSTHLQQAGMVEQDEDGVWRRLVPLQNA